MALARRHLRGAARSGGDRRLPRRYRIQRDGGGRFHAVARPPPNAHALDALPAGAEGVAALARAYTLLFSGAGGPQTVPPYESAFTTPNGRLFGEPEARMRALLAELNLHVAKELGEAADHVAVEFAVMAELPAGSARRDDLARHLDRWLNDFRAGCAARDGTGFYAGAAMVATALARQELAGRAVDVDA